MTHASASGGYDANVGQKTPRFVELQGRIFLPAQQIPTPEWPCVQSVQQQQQTLTVKDDDVFLITDTLGNISGCDGNQFAASLGLFCRDTRFLSRLELQIEGRLPILLSSTAQRGYALSALCANPSIPATARRSEIPVETIGIQREMVLQGGLFEELSLTNYGTETVTFELSLSFAADFADLFEIRGVVMRSRTGTLMRQIPAYSTAAPHRFSTVESDALAAKQGELILAYQGIDDHLVESRIQFQHQRPERFSGNTALWQITLEPHKPLKLGYALCPWVDGQPASAVIAPATLSQALAAETQEEEEWSDRVTCVLTDDRTLNQIIERAEEDIYLLGQSFGEGKALSAGIPWFSTLFGRDSIIAAQQTLMLNSDIARETLKVLAHYQGQETNDWREEEPGKILHELRRGEFARSGEIPHTPYYGTVDATPLWLMLYADYYAWTGDRAFLDNLWEHAVAAMDWIDHSCEAGNGYLTYEQKSPRGLINQGWKDSTNCIVNAKGELAQGAIALSEVQGYAYAARTRMAHLAHLRQQPDLAERWHQSAQALKQRFSEDFWLPTQGYCALALDGEGRPFDSISSNPGHCLGLGILSPEQEQSIAERLQAPDMFSGWGIRTLSSASPAYNPMGYHIGSIWPHDNALVVAGLRAIGRTSQALEVAQGILDMTAEQTYQRPPELFCGFDRTPGSSPVRYPVACSPQAWASSTIFQLVQSMVNLVPDAPNNCLTVMHPTLHGSVKQILLKNLRVGQTILDLAIERSGDSTACRVLRKRGNLRVIIEA